MKIATPRDPRTGTSEIVLDPLDWVRTMTSHIPDRRRHLVRYYGAYACRTRGARRRRSASSVPRTVAREFAADAGPATTGRDKKSWARLLRKLLEVDPLVCGRCGARMQVIAVITDLRVVDEILGHVAHGGGHDPFDGRAPPAE